MIKIVKAELKHREFILFANKQIHNISEQTLETRLDKHLDADYFCNNPKFECIIAEDNGKPVGMCLYSKMYWADDGEVLWISQMFVIKEYRKSGAFFKILNALKNFNKEAKIVACATAHTNNTMKKILKFFGAKLIDMDFYAKII